jgi:hypothetical protein
MSLAAAMPWFRTHCGLFQKSLILLGFLMILPRRLLLSLWDSPLRRQILPALLRMLPPMIEAKMADA